MLVPLILNPESGDAVPNQEKATAILASLASGGIQPSLRWISDQNSAEELTRAALRENAPLIVVGGGDGTVRRVAAELAGKPARLGILPMGTYNNIARSMGIPLDEKLACAVITSGRERTMDIGILNDTHLFFEATGCGLDAELFPLGEEIKSGHWSRLWQFARRTWSFVPRTITLTFDRSVQEAAMGHLRKQGRRYSRTSTIRLKSLMTVVANGPYYGGGFTVAPQARLNDGLLTINVYRHFSKWELMRHFWSIGRGKYRYSPKVESFNAGEVRIESEAALPVHCDGEHVGGTPALLRSIPAALRVMVPDPENQSA